jgi:amino acid transporter
VPDPAAVMEDVVTGEPAYGLRKQILSPLEVLAQSVSVIAPSSTPPITIPLVFALAGEGTWLAYALAMATMMLIAFCIAEFARDSASPGSLYVYTRQTLPPVFAAVEAWALFFAYVVTTAGTAAAVVFLAYPFLGRFGTHVPTAVMAALCLGAVAWIAGRDIRISTEAMLWIEVVSVLLIVAVVGILLWKQGLHLDWPQWKLQGVTARNESLAVMLALFSFVGFESATSLGEEAREPLKTIPQAVVRSALLAGIFFMVCAYGEVLGFRGVTPGLGEHEEPMRFLAVRAGVGWAGWVINLGVLVSMLACTLGCVIAAARVLLLMAHHGLAHKRFMSTDKKQETPAAAGVFVALLAFVPLAILAQRGIKAEQMFPWLGTLSVYGFMTAYGLVALALPCHLKKVGRLSAVGVAIAIAAAGASLAAMVGTMYPLPPAPYLYLPYIYMAYMASGMAWWWTMARRPAESEPLTGSSVQ